MITADGEERDWLAWFATFAPTFALSAHTGRVIGASAFARDWDAFKRPISERLRAVVLGLVLGEMLCSEDFTKSVSL